MTTDNELLALFVQRNDPNALEQLVRRHWVMVFSVCQSLLWNQEDAEDAFQAVFLLLARKAPKLISHNSVGGWLHESATRICFQLRRRASRSREATLIEEPATQNEPWKTISFNRECELLHKEISRLPKKYREVIILYHLEGKSRAQIAKVLDCTTASVKAALARGRKSLRQRLIRRGVIASAVVASMTMVTGQIQAGTSRTELLIDSTLQHCHGMEPTECVGNGSEFIEPLLAKETMMSVLTFSKLTTVAASMMMLLGMTVAAIASGQTEVSEQPTEIVLEQSLVAFDESPGASLSVAAENTAEASTTFSSPTDAESEQSQDKKEKGSDQADSKKKDKEKKGDPPVVTVPPMNIQLIKYDGKSIYYERSTMVYGKDSKPITETVPQTYTVMVPYIEDGVTKTRAETRTRTIAVTRMSDATRKTLNVPIKSGSFESLSGKKIKESDMIDRIGMSDFPVLVLGKSQKLPEAYKLVLKPDTIILRGSNVTTGPNFALPAVGPQLTAPVRRR